MTGLVSTATQSICQNWLAMNDNLTSLVTSDENKTAVASFSTMAATFFAGSLTGHPLIGAALALLEGLGLPLSLHGDAYFCGHEPKVDIQKVTDLTFTGAPARAFNVFKDSILELAANRQDKNKN